ncbi:RDD family protein [Paenibacillus sp. FSL K6-2524]|uniref:RDD family protein n=1 Tax=Paenibacillus sp. FSL K6-2524 TaxID=2954516 RepID=UPI0030F4E0B9
MYDNRDSSKNNYDYQQGMIYRNPNPEFVGFWVRLLAFLIDCVILEILTWFSPFNWVAEWILSFLYFTLLPCTAWQGTVGKLILSVKIVDEEGEKISYLRSIGRYLARFISAIILCIGFIMIAFNEKKRGLHDLMAGTYVIKKESKLYD